MSNKMPEGIRTAMMWVLGLGIIALILLILLILFGNLQGNVGFGSEVQETFSGNNLSLGPTNTNVTDLTGLINPTLASVLVINSTNGSTGLNVVPASNYTIDGGNIRINQPGGTFNASYVNVSGVLSSDEQGKIDSDNLITNYTKSATNVSAQFPVVGTIIGIALLLVVLIGVLIFAVRKIMGITGGTGSSGSSSSSKFNGSSSSSFG